MSAHRPAVRPMGRTGTTPGASPISTPTGQACCPVTPSGLRVELIQLASCATKAAVLGIMFLSNGLGQLILFPQRLSDGIPGLIRRLLLRHPMTVRSNGRALLER